MNFIIYLENKVFDLLFMKRVYYFVMIYDSYDRMVDFRVFCVWKIEVLGIRIVYYE